jgi:hypothetical protein
VSAPACDAASSSMTAASSASFADIAFVASSARVPNIKGFFQFSACREHSVWDTLGVLRSISDKDGSG